jgi:hypothetical protein
VSGGPIWKKYSNRIKSHHDTGIETMIDASIVKHAIPSTLVSAKEPMGRYEPNYEPLKQHPVPQWFHKCKARHFHSLRLFSVPAWAPLAGA